MAHAVVRRMESRGDLSRRRAMTGGIIGLGTLIGLGYLGLAIRFIFPVNASGAGGSGLQPAGTVASFPVGNPVLIEYKEPTGIPTGVFVVNKGGNQFDAFDFHCTHLQCPIAAVPPSQGKPAFFACPCHGSQFFLNGNVKRGPAPIPLLRHVITVQNGQVEVGGLA